MKIFCLLSAVLSVSSLFAQDFNDYQLLQCSGSIPTDFLMNVDEKTLDASEDNSGDEILNSKKLARQFYFESSYEINQILMSGYVLFNDPVTVYLNDIKNKLLENDEELQKEIRVYTLRSTEVNAYCFNNGIILFSLGLVAQVENEAQLAFVLSHEIQHYVNKHSFVQFSLNRNIDKGRTREFSNLSKKERQFLKLHFSKEHEMEADLQALDNYLSAGYAVDEVDGAYDVLQYSFLPFDEIKFEKTFFESADFVLPEEYFLQELSPIEIPDDYNDSLLTHPNIKKRREKAAEELATIDNPEKGLEYVISQDRFRTIQQSCRYELCYRYLVDGDYSYALYSSYILLKKNPESLFLQRTLSNALYLIATYKNQGGYSNVISSYKDYMGSVQQVYHLLQKIKSKELTVFALRYAWASHLNYPDDFRLNEICESLATQLIKEHNMDLEDFSENEKKAAPDSMAVQIDTSQTKYEKIKQQKKDLELDWYEYAFVPFMKDNSFRNLFEEDKEQPIISRNNLFNEDKGTYSLGCDEIAIVHSYYAKIITRKKESMQYEASDYSQQRVSSILQECADKLDLKIQDFSTDHLHESATQKFNQHALLNDWMIENMMHDDNGVDLKAVSFGEIKKINTELGTTHFMWNLIYSIREPRPMKYLYCCTGIVPYVIPLALYYFLTPRNSTIFYSLVLNSETGDAEMFYTNTMRTNDNDATLKSNIYYILRQVKQESKNKKP